MWNKAEYSEYMQKSLNVFANDLGGIRAGRAHAGLLEGIYAESYGQKIKISQISTISISGVDILSVMPYDKSSLIGIEKAINEANLRVTVSSNGNSILVKLPKMSEDTRKDLIKFVNKTSETSKLAIRNIRRDGMEALKKMEKDKQISEDEKKRNEIILQKLTDEFIAKIEDMIAKKEKEIMEI